ncbi:unnamed protein product [Closterium sp. NIES-64]|nr:unnamed protein product [Closterium sp. NIES-64]CAI6010173.1 unnamed protein product [Closterium sp. NIES-65]
MGGRIVDIPLIPSGLSRDDTYRHIHHSLLLLQQVSEAVLQRVQQRVDEEAKLVADISKRVTTASNQVDSLLSTRASIHIQSPVSLPTPTTRLTRLTSQPPHVHNDASLTTAGSSCGLLFPTTVPLLLEAEAETAIPGATRATSASKATTASVAQSANASQNLPGQPLPAPPALPASLASEKSFISTSSSAETLAGDYIEGESTPAADSSVGDPRGFLAAPQLAAFFATSSIAAAGIPSTSVTGLPNFRGDLAVTGVSAAPMSRASGGDGAGEGAVGGVLLSGKEGGVRREVLLPNPPGGMMLLSDLLPASSATSHGTSLDSRGTAAGEGANSGVEEARESRAFGMRAATTTAERCLELLQQPLTPLAMSEFQFQPQLSKALDFALPDSLPLPFGASPGDSPGFLGGSDES